MSHFFWGEGPVLRISLELGGPKPHLLLRGEPGAFILCCGGLVGGHEKRQLGVYSLAAIFCRSSVPIPAEGAAFTQADSDHSLGPAGGPRSRGGEGADPGRGGARTQNGLQVRPRGRLARLARLTLWVGEDAVYLNREHQAGEEEAVQRHHEKEEQRAPQAHGGLQVPLAARVGAQGRHGQQSGTCSAPSAV